MDNAEIYIKEFKIEEIEPSCSWVVVGAPGRGKSTFIENLIYFNRWKYPVGQFYNGSEVANKTYAKYAPGIFIFNEYSPDSDELYVRRQKMSIEDNGKSNVQNFAVHVMDDCTDNVQIFKSKLMSNHFKIGTRHYDNLNIIASHTTKDMPPSVRCCISYVALFSVSNDEELKKMYDNYGGVFKNRQVFKNIMDQVTGDYTCLIINNRTDSNKIEDKVFWYKTTPLPKWKFGCKEAWEWDDMRNDPRKQDIE